MYIAGAMLSLLWLVIILFLGWALWSLLGARGH